MKFYHGTNNHGLNETKVQGYLLHKRATKRYPNISPCTYLAIDKKEARQYGNILLKVEYDPNMNPKYNNYHIGCWQVRVYEPIYEFKVI